MNCSEWNHYTRDNSIVLAVWVEKGELLFTDFHLLFTSSISVPDLLLHLGVDSRATFLFSHKSLAQWIEMWFWCNLYKYYWKMCESPQCYQSFYQTQRGEFDFVFFSLGLHSLPQDMLHFNEAVGLSTAQLLLHKVSCEALRATCTKQINHFCEDFQRPLF